MFNIGSWELIIIVIAALLLLGPKKLPDFARFIGSALREVRNVTQEVRNALDMEVEKAELEELKRQFEEDLSVDNLLHPPPQGPHESLEDAPLEVVAPADVAPVYNDEEPAEGLPAPPPSDSSEDDEPALHSLAQGAHDAQDADLVSNEPPVDSDAAEPPSAPPSRD